MVINIMSWTVFNTAHTFNAFAHVGSIKIGIDSCPRPLHANNPCQKIVVEIRL